jgi:GntR family transcriptional regulator/MocR family aminotransferase
MSMRHARAVDIAEMIAPEGAGSPRDRLAAGLRAAILSGQMRAGDAIPSSRTLASAVGIARGTVVRIYDELSGEGYLETVHGSGTFVSMGVPLRGVQHSSGPAATGVGTSPTSAETSTHAAPIVTASRMIELRPGIPSTASITRGDWASAWRRATAGEVAATYPPAAGLPALREQIARHLFNSRGLACDADDVIVTSGLREGLALIALGLEAQIDRPLRVGCENPGHVGSRAVLARLGAELVPIDVVDGGVDFDSVHESRISALLVTPSHQYPLGGSLDVGRRLQLLEWAKRTHSIIIEDDYDSEFRHVGRALPSIASLDDSGCVVHVGSYSKVITPWLRCGYVVARDPAMRAAILDARADVGETVSGIPQQALAHYLETGGLSRHLAGPGRAYAHKRALVLDALGGELGSSLVLRALDGGLHAVLSSPAGRGNADLAERLSHRGISASELARHYFGSTPPPHEGIVFGYGAATDLELQSALAEIRRETV